MNLQPTLKGELLTLRPLMPGDFEQLYLAASDPLVWEQHPQSDRYKRDVFEGFFQRALESRGALAVTDNAAGSMIGSSRYYDFTGEKVTVGYTFLARSHWGGRFNGEMKRLMLEHAFRHVGRVLFEIGECNLRSRRAIEKIGGRVLDRKMLNGNPYFTYYIDR